MTRGCIKLAVVVLVAVLICIASLSQSWHRQVSQLPQPMNRLGGKKGKKLHAWNSGENLVGFWDLLNKSYVEDLVPRPQVGDHICEDVLCSEFLNQEDLNGVSRCLKMFKHCQLANDKGPTRAPTCHFVNGTSRAGNVALISFPGSGNTWTRGLLEKATGICTGDENPHFPCKGFVLE